MRKHTPGPWIIDGETHDGSYQGWLCTASGPRGRMEPVAHIEACSPSDITLIAAAPDMAEALRDANEVIKHVQYFYKGSQMNGEDFADVIAKNNAALAKAGL